MYAKYIPSNYRTEIRRFVPFVPSSSTRAEQDYSSSGGWNMIDAFPLEILLADSVVREAAVQQQPDTS